MKKRDAINTFEKSLVDFEIVTQKKIDAVYKKVNSEIEKAIEFAEQSPYPDPSALLDNVYSEEGA